METIHADPEILDESAVEDAQDRRLLKRVRRVAGRIPFARHVAAMWFALRDDETPMAAKGVILGALAYFMMPADLVPDFILALGFTDDAAVIAAAIKTVADQVKPKHYDAADASLR